MVPARLQPQAPRRGLFSRPAPPYLLAGDVAAYTVIALPLAHSALVVLVGLLVLLVGQALGGLYRSRLTFDLLDDLPYVAASVLASGVAAQWLEAARGSAGGLGARLFEGGALVVALLIVRCVEYATLRYQRRTGRVRHATLVLGAGHVGIRLTETLQAHPEFGLHPVGLVDDQPRSDGRTPLPVPHVGGYDDLSALIEQSRAKVVVVAFGAMREEQLVEVLRTCDRLHCEIMFVPRLFELQTTTRRMDQAWGIPLVRVRRAPFRSVTWRVKRVVDVVGAAVALVVLSPLLCLCAVAVRVGSGPDVLFRQERVGLDGRPFTLLKFRTLRPADPAESASLWSVSNDHRIGRVGRVLRSTSLDELPQLWNVLRGDMSLVGPRPERQHFVDEFSSRVPRYTARHRVPAGLTGWAQVHGLRGDTSIEDRAGFDNYYIENWSLWLDAKILVRTVEQVVRRAGS